MIFIKRKITRLYYTLKSKLFTGVLIDSETRLGRRVFVGRGTDIRGTDIEGYTYLGLNCSLSEASIGSFCSIGSNVRLTKGEHPTSIFVSTHPSFFSKGYNGGTRFTDGQEYFNQLKRLNGGKLLEIGNDVWIGDNVLLRGGLRIATGVVIGMGSVVVKDCLCPYGIYAGNPAKLIKFRFTEQEIEQLLATKWWEREHEWFKNNAHLMRDINSFLDAYKD